MTTFFGHALKAYNKASLLKSRKSLNFDVVVFQFGWVFERTMFFCSFTAKMNDESVFACSI